MDANKKIVGAFTAVVNMSADELESWLSTPESRQVGWKHGDANRESVGHASGRRIVAPDDYAHMRKVVGFVKRHRAQQPANVVSSRWRYSLMNWGHDPLKEIDH